MSLLETVMFQADVVASLGEVGPDLLDYTVRGVTDLLYPLDKGQDIGQDGMSKGELSSTSEKIGKT